MRILIGRTSLLLVVFSALIAYAFIQFERPTIGVDDANISFVYARHLAQGHGFVYNIGGERVEGFTTLLWVLISALTFYLFERPEIILIVLNLFLLVAANLTAIYYLYQSNQKQLDISILVAYLVLVLVIPDYIIWMSLPIMETGLWSFLLMATTVVVLMVNKNSGIRYALLLSILVGAMILTRPEAIAWGAIFILLVGIQLAVLTGIRSTLKLVAIPAITYVGVLGGLTLFRLAYFGYPLPNTYYAKVSPSVLINLKTGFEYFISYINSGFLISIIVFGTIIFFVYDSINFLNSFRSEVKIAQDRTWIMKRFTLGLICMVGLVLPVLPGGDHFKSFRFYQPIYPLLVVYLLNHWMSLLSGKPYFRWLTLASVGLMIFFVFYTHDVTWKNIGEKGASILVEFRIAKQGREQGATLASLFEDLEKYPSLGTITSGGVKMTYPGEVVDLLGLNNLRMGHSSGLREGTKNHAAFNREVFFQLQPQIIGSSCNPLNELYLPGLNDDQQFQDLYNCATVRQVGMKGKYQAYFHRDFLAQLSGDDRYKVDILSGENPP